MIDDMDSGLLRPNPFEPFCLPGFLFDFDELAGCGIILFFDEEVDSEFSFATLDPSDF